MAASTDNHPDDGDTKLHVLLLEEEGDARESLRLLLELHGHQVHCAENARRGLGLLALHKPDAVLVNMIMPGMDGLEFARQARKIAGGAALVALTANTSEDIRMQSRSAGFDARLPQLSTFALIHRALRNAVASRRAAHAQTESDMSGSGHGY